MVEIRFRLATAAAVIALGLAGVTAAAGPAASLQGSRDREMGASLPLGPAGATQTESSAVLEPGVTLTRIVRGAVRR